MEQLEHLHWSLNEALSLKPRPFLPPSTVGFSYFVLTLFDIFLMLCKQKPLLSSSSSSSFILNAEAGICVPVSSLLSQFFVCDSVSKVCVFYHCLLPYPLADLLYQCHKTFTCFIFFCSTRLHCFLSRFLGKWSHSRWISELTPLLRQWSHL